MTDLLAAQQEVKESLHPSAVHVTEDSDAVPDHWKGYLSGDLQERLAAAHAELAMISDLFPTATEGLRKVTSDAFLMRTDQHGLCRFLIKKADDAYYPVYSRTPKSLMPTAHDDAWDVISRQAPRALVSVYNEVMDGLTDVYDFAGFTSSLVMSSMHDEEMAYGELDWYDDYALRVDTRNVIELFSNGSGVHLLVNLNDGLSGTANPQAMLISSKVPWWTQENIVDLFPTLDTWMEIRLTQ